MQTNEFKDMIFLIVTRSGEVDAKGKYVLRTSYKKEFLRGVQQITAAFTAQREVGLLPNFIQADAAKPEDFEWVPFDRFKIQDDKQAILERNTDDPIIFNEIMKKSFKYCYDSWDEIPLVSAQTLDQIEAIIE